MSGLDSRVLFVAVVAVVALQRLLELGLSSRNESRLRARGGVEAGGSHYPWMVALHAGLLVSGPVEVWLLGRPFLPALSAVMAFLLVAATALRYWTIRTLGERWTTRVIYLPDSEPVTDGPFRLVRHPNYLAVMVEIVALPLLHTGWVTALVFGGFNALLLKERIRVEQKALTEHTRYSQAFGTAGGRRVP